MFVVKVKCVNSKFLLNFVGCQINVELRSDGCFIERFGTSVLQHLVSVPRARFMVTCHRFTTGEQTKHRK